MSTPHHDDPTLTRLLFPQPPARPAAIVARTVGLRRTHAHGVLDGLDLHVAVGELVAVLGERHAGKSTLVRSLAGLDRDGNGVVDVASRRAVVLQRPSLIPWKRVLANVTFGVRQRGGDREGLAALEQVGLAGQADAWPTDLTHEATIRVLIARALLRDPALLLLDDPFAGLHTDDRRRLHRLLRSLSCALDLAVLLTCDRAADAIGVADRVVVLRDGVIEAEVEMGLTEDRDPAGAGFQRLELQLTSALNGVRTLSA